MTLLHYAALLTYQTMASFLLSRVPSSALDVQDMNGCTNVSSIISLFKVLRKPIFFFLTVYRQRFTLCSTDKQSNTSAPTSAKQCESIGRVKSLTLKCWAD